VVTYKTYKTVEQQFSNAQTTPHEIEITGKERELKKTFDVGKAIKSRYSTVKVEQIAEIDLVLEPVAK
jgi:hypothetical protein